MSTEVVGRERRRIPIRAPLTGLVLVLIVVFGTYWGWQSAFGTGNDPAAAGCETTTPATTTTTTTPGVTPPTTSAATVVALAAAVTTAPTTTVPTDGSILLPEDVTVNVYNATIRGGLANNTAAELQNRGFDISAVSNDPLDATIPGVAEIRAATIDSPEVRLVIQHVPGAVVVADARADASVDVVLGETFTALGDPATVTPVPIASPRC